MALDYEYHNMNKEEALLLAAALTAAQSDSNDSASKGLIESAEPMTAEVEVK